MTVPSSNSKLKPLMGKYSGFGIPPPREIMPGILVSGIKDRIALCWESKKTLRRLCFFWCFRKEIEIESHRLPRWSNRREVLGIILESRHGALESGKLEWQLESWCELDTEIDKTQKEQRNTLSSRGSRGPVKAPPEGSRGSAAGSQPQLHPRQPHNFFPLSLLLHTTSGSFISSLD